MFFLFYKAASQNGRKRSTGTEIPAGIYFFSLEKNFPKINSAAGKRLEKKIKEYKLTKCRRKRPVIRAWCVAFVVSLHEEGKDGLCALAARINGPSAVAATRNTP